MSVVEALTVLGGVATRAALVDATSRALVDQAVAAGEVVVLARGRYALASTDRSRAVAHELSAVLSHRSAALHWGWAVRTPPARPDVIVPDNRRLTKAQCSKVVVHRASLLPDDVVDGVTSRERTLLDCTRSLPYAEALAVADSALRDGWSHRRLAAIARDARGPGVVQARLVVARADGRAANPFESTLRAIAHEVAGLDLRPQVEIHDPDFLGRPDLVDTDLRIIAEADSFEWHGGREELARDARRYNAFVVSGWLVLRFSWDDVMHHADVVRATLVAAVRRRSEGLCDVGCTAQPQGRDG